MPDDSIDPFRRLDAMNACGISSETPKPNLIINGADRPATVHAPRELHRAPGLPLQDRGARSDVPTQFDIVHPKGDQVTPRSLRSIARLNMARSRSRSAI